MEIFYVLTKYVQFKSSAAEVLYEGKGLINHFNAVNPFPICRHIMMHLQLTTFENDVAKEKKMF